MQTAPILMVTEPRFRHRVTDQTQALHTAEHLNQSQGEMRRWWGSDDGAGPFSKYG